MRLNSAHRCSQERSIVACDRSGVWICAWESRHDLNGTGTDVDIFYARSTDLGLTWSNAAALNINATSDTRHDYDPQIATDDQGRWMAVWRSLDSLTGTIGIDADIVCSRSVTNGAPGTWSFPQPVNTNASSDSGADIKPRLVTDRNGRWLVAWESNDTFGGTLGSDYDIFVARTTWSGEASIVWSPPAPLNSNAAADSGADSDVTLATDAQGNYIAAWSSADSLGNTIGADQDVLFARSGDHGQTWSAVAALHANAGADSGHDTLPSMKCASGECVVVWTSTTNLGGTIGADMDLLIARSPDAGQTWSFPAAFNSAGNDSGADDAACILADVRGGWLVLWETRDSLGATIGTEGDLLVAHFALPDCNFNLTPDSIETDCNNNLVPDDCDIASGTSLDLNNNGVPDECDSPPPACPADCAPPPDGVVNVSDLLYVISHWGQSGSAADINGDGVVNVGDLLAVISAWGPCP